MNLVCSLFFRFSHTCNFCYFPRAFMQSPEEVEKGDEKNSSDLEARMLLGQVLLECGDFDRG